MGKQDNYSSGGSKTSDSMGFDELDNIISQGESGPVSNTTSFEGEEGSVQRIVDSDRPNEGLVLTSYKDAIRNHIRQGINDYDGQTFPQIMSNVHCKKIRPAEVEHSSELLFARAFRGVLGTEILNPYGKGKKSGLSFTQRQLARFITYFVDSFFYSRSMWRGYGLKLRLKKMWVGFVGAFGFSSKYINFDLHTYNPSDRNLDGMQNSVFSKVLLSRLSSQVVESPEGRSIRVVQSPGVLGYLCRMTTAFMSGMLKEMEAAKQGVAIAEDKRITGYLKEMLAQNSEGLKESLVGMNFPYFIANFLVRLLVFLCSRKLFVAIINRELLKNSLGDGNKDGVEFSSRSYQCFASVLEKFANQSFPFSPNVGEEEANALKDFVREIEFMEPFHEAPNGKELSAFTAACIQKLQTNGEVMLRTGSVLHNTLIRIKKTQDTDGKDQYSVVVYDTSDQCPFGKPSTVTALYDKSGKKISKRHIEKDQVKGIREFKLKIDSSSEDSVAENLWDFIFAANYIGYHAPISKNRHMMEDFMRSYVGKEIRYSAVDRAPDSNQVAHQFKLMSGEVIPERVAKKMQESKGKGKVLSEEEKKDLEKSARVQGEKTFYEFMNVVGRINTPEVNKVLSADSPDRLEGKDIVASDIDPRSIHVRFIVDNKEAEDIIKKDMEQINSVKKRIADDLTSKRITYDQAIIELRRLYQSSPAANYLYDIAKDLGFDLAHSPDDFANKMGFDIISKGSSAEFPRRNNYIAIYGDGRSFSDRGALNSEEIDKLRQLKIPEDRIVKKGDRLLYVVPSVDQDLFMGAGIITNDANALKKEENEEPSNFLKNLSSVDKSKITDEISKMGINTLDKVMSTASDEEKLALWDKTYHKVSIYTNMFPRMNDYQFGLFGDFINIVGRNRIGGVHSAGRGHVEESNAHGVIARAYNVELAKRKAAMGIEEEGQGTPSTGIQEGGASPNFGGEGRGEGGGAQPHTPKGISGR